MTVRELIEASPNCDTLEVIIREKGMSKWIQGYLIGKNVDYYPAFARADVREDYTSISKRRLKAGEEQDGFHGIHLPMKLIKKPVNNLPDNVANLVVAHIQPRHIPCYHREQMTHNEFSYDVNVYPEGWMPEEEKIDIGNDVDDKGQLIGQMSLEDL